MPQCLCQRPESDNRVVTELTTACQLHHSHCAGLCCWSFLFDPLFHPDLTGNPLETALSKAEPHQDWFGVLYVGQRVSGSTTETQHFRWESYCEMDVRTPKCPGSYITSFLLVKFGLWDESILGWVRHDMTVLFSNAILLPVCAITNIQLSLYPRRLKVSKSMTVTCGFHLAPCVLSAVCSVLHHNSLSGYADLCWRVVYVTESPLTEGSWGGPC